MAGSFGYEQEKYDVSIACGERVLLPEVRKAGLSTIIMADGFSCKEQIEQQTNRHALHLAEVLHMAQRDSEHGPSLIYPEKQLIEPRLRAQQRSMMRAGVATLLIITGAIFLGVAWHKRK